MTAAEVRFWARARARTAILQPDMARAILRAFENVRNGMDRATLARFLREGALDRMLSAVLGDPILDRALVPVGAQLQQTVADSFRSAIRDLPGTAAGISFDYLNPRVIDAIRTLNARVMTGLKDDIRETVRAYVENALRDGVGAGTIARQLRGVIGLAPNQLDYVANLRAELESGKYADAARRVLIDKRFNLAKLDGLSATDRAARIDTIVEAYRKSWLTTNAVTNAHTAMLQSYKLGQQLAWDDAKEKGVIPEGFGLQKRWRQIPRPTRREEHIPLDGEVVPFDEPYSNGQTIPGETDFNCGCLSEIFLSRIV